MMPEPMKLKLRHLLVEHEGYENFPYVDTVGKITIGIGYNLSDRGMSDTWINNQFEEDTSYFYNQMNDDFPWFKRLNDARQIALIDMCFMGYRKFKTFKKMLDAFANEDYLLASKEALDSKWAEQVKGRANQIAHIILSGKL